MDPALIETLRLAQRLGFFGPGAIERAIVHAQGYVTALGDLPHATRFVDLGSGGGLPGLVLAHAYPDCAITLIDRRTKRTDFLERAVRRLGYDHVSVRAADVAVLVSEVAEGSVAPFDVVTARGFGPPDFTLRTAAAVVHRAGRIVISEPPVGDRWPSELLADLGVSGELVGQVRVFRFT